MDNRDHREARHSPVSAPYRDRRKAASAWSRRRLNSRHSRESRDADAMIGLEQAVDCPRAISSHRCRSGIGARMAQEVADPRSGHLPSRSEEHTSELQSLMPISYAVFCFTKKI